MNVLFLRTGQAIITAPVPGPDVKQLKNAGMEFQGGRT